MLLAAVTAPLSSVSPWLAELCCGQLMSERPENDFSAPPEGEMADIVLDPSILGDTETRGDSECFLLTGGDIANGLLLSKILPVKCACYLI